MKVVLCSNVFDRLSSTEAALFLWLGGCGRHRIVVEDEQAAGYLRWYEALSPSFAADWSTMVALSISELAVNPSFHEIRIEECKVSSWRDLVLTVTDAMDLLQRPYRILVENGYSDRAFLLSFFGTQDREWIENRIDREWVEVEHCGGIDHLGKRAVEIKRDPSRSARASALFDGDALRPKQPSAKNKRISENCYPEIHHHMLERRCIENYLPRSALEGWARRSDGRQEKIRESRVRHLFDQLGPEQREHFNFKEGFEGDSKRHDRAEDLFEKLPAETQRMLEKGLEPDIAAIYRERRVRWHELENSAKRELQPFVSELLARIR